VQGAQEAAGLRVLGRPCLSSFLDVIRSCAGDIEKMKLCDPTTMTSATGGAA
jgi:hypothetical protein